MTARSLLLTISLVPLLVLAGCGRESTPPEDETAAPAASAAEEVEGTEMVSVGDEAPDFALQASTGEEIRLSALRGKPVVLYFYPKDDTPGCTTEACAFRDALDQFAEQGVVVLGVSLDDVESHRAFAEKYKLPFPLLADTTGAVAALYGVLGEYQPPEGEPISIARRVTFLIDANGIVRRVWTDVDPAVHAPEVLAAVRELGGQPAA